MPTNDVASAKRRLALPFNENERVDVALATNMISVGLDIVRLGLMVVLGQPKTSAEYIQATSRVGRDPTKPGLIVTLLNVHKPRDRSHYERFETYHATFYRAVEATSVTPFSPRALDRALAAALVALCRQARPEMTPALKAVEFEALSQAKEELGSDVPDGNFFARSLPRSVWDAPWMALIDRVVLAHRLREVVAQLGFTRFEAAGPDIEGELSLEVKRAPISLDTSWLPAIENRGEGIFLLFKPDAIEKWLKRREVQERGRHLAAGFARWKVEHEASNREFPGLPFYLLHSFSHLLLTAISLECGYPASSLRERIYGSHDRYGILVYTGSSDAEGTLGGLVAARASVMCGVHSITVCCARTTRFVLITHPQSPINNYCWAARATVAS